MCQTEDAITQKLVHWVSSQQEVVDSDDDVEDLDMGLLGVDYGSDMEGVLSGCEEIVPIEFRPCLLNKESCKLRPCLTCSNFHKSFFFFFVSNL